MNIKEINAEVMELAAIWLENKIEIVRDRKVLQTVRIIPGDEIRHTEYGIEPYGLTTHKVIHCKGNINNSVLYFECENILTEEPIIIML